MKAYKLELKVLTPERATDLDAPDPKPVRYRDLIELVLRSAGPAGITKPEMKKRNAMRRALKEAIESQAHHVLFSIEQGEKLKELVENFPWGMASYELEQFMDDVAAMPTVSLAEKPAEERPA